MQQRGEVRLAAGTADLYSHLLEPLADGGGVKRRHIQIKGLHGILQTRDGHAIFLKQKDNRAYQRFMNKYRFAKR